MTQLDYTLKTAEERNELVKKIIAESDPSALTPYYLTKLSNYLIEATPKSRQILTDNRLFTINRHETSYEGICGKLENGEDGIYNMMSDLGKASRLTLKDPITKEDIESIPPLASLTEEIKKIEAAIPSATGKKKYLLSKQLKEMYQDRYVIRDDYRGGVFTKRSAGSSTLKGIATYNFYDCVTFDKNGYPQNSGPISFFNPKHIEALLCNYSGLRMEADGRFENDLWYLLKDLDNLIEATLPTKYPYYYDLLILKIDGRTNIEIQQELLEKHNIKHSIEYISSLWRKKIPKLIAEQATKDYLIWYYTYVERGKWKKCTRCGEIKLAHNIFYSRNRGSYDGWYSLCKECRNRKASGQDNLKEIK